MNTKANGWNEERFNNLVTMLIASVAIWVAITVFFQNYASNSAEQARRRAQENAIASTKKQLNGEIQFSYEWQGAYQTWREIGWQITAAEQENDTQAAERYTKLQERVAKVSRLLGPDYFDPSQNSRPDIWKYQSDAYLVEYTRLNEIYIAESEFGQATDKTADSLVVQITLLTVSLSLYGLSITLKGKVRWLFVALGSGIVAVCMLWLIISMVQLAVRPGVNTKAIQAYSQGVGLAYQARYDEAIAKFDEAVSEKSDYGRAFSERASANLDMGNYESAIRDYELARNAGFDNSRTNTNLGWAYYLNGEFEKGIEADQRAVKSDNYKIVAQLNEALTYLAMGDMSNSKKQYDALLEETQQQVKDARSSNTQPPASIWYYLDAGAADLQSLIDQLGNTPKSWTQAPPSASVPGDHEALRNFAFQQMIRLKEANTALEYTGELPVAHEVMRVDPFSFGQVTETNDQGLVTKFEAAPNFSFPNQTKSVTVEYSYSGPPPQQVIWKVYFNGVEDISQRIVSNADLSSGTVWYQPFGYDYTSVFVFTPGEFVVELYADSRLVQTGTFYVEP